ncbi:MAG: ubiquinol oxidase subunit II [Pseudomonadota bacterium]
MSTSLLLSGCIFADAPILFPKGPIAEAQRDLLFDAFYLMMIVTIPVIVLAIWFGIRYRSKGKATYTPDWGGSWQYETVIWAVPAILVAVIGTLLWTSTHKLDPYKAIVSDQPVFQVQAVALDWKWLFLYPDLGIASVNELAFPADRPLQIEITSDTVMNSLMIPALGGQIYAMAGMRSELNLLANAPGSFTGRNTMFSGDGFADQHFQAHAMSVDDFSAWQSRVTASASALDAAAYSALHKQSTAHPVTYYARYEDCLFRDIIVKYAPRQGDHAAGHDGQRLGDIPCREAS